MFKKILEGGLLIVTAVFLVLFAFEEIQSFSPQKNYVPNYPLTEVEVNMAQTDIGKIVSDTTIRVLYSFTNVGRDSLHVLFVHPDCNCTGYKLSQDVCAKNDSIQVVIDIDMHNKRLGKFMLTTIVALNTEQKLYRLCVEGDIVDNK